MVVRHSNDLVHWVKFFLVAVIEIAVKGKKTFHEILNLKNEIDGKIVSLGRKSSQSIILFV
jgi:hypothetical protein